MATFKELTRDERLDLSAERLEDLVMEAAVMLPADEYVDVFVGLIARLTAHVDAAPVLVYRTSDMTEAQAEAISAFVVAVTA